MKTAFLQPAFLLFAAAPLTLAAPTTTNEVDSAKRKEMQSLCRTSSYHCVYADGTSPSINAYTAYRCDSTLTFCVFQSGKAGSVVCPVGIVNFSFGSPNSYFTTTGDSQAYFSSHDGDTHNTKSNVAGDDLHVTCG